jgi:hypothetical protein
VPLNHNVRCHIPEDRNFNIPGKSTLVGLKLEWKCNGFYENKFSKVLTMVYNIQKQLPSGLCPSSG